MADLTTLLSKFLVDLYAGSVTLTGRVRVGDGSAAAPSFSFGSTGNTDNGMFLSASDTVAWSAGGTQRLSLSTTALTSTVPVLAPNGSAAAPSYSFASQSTTGMFLSSAGVMAFSSAGTTTATLRANGDLRLATNSAELSFGASADASIAWGATKRLTIKNAAVLTPVAFGSLPTAAEGAIASVNDSNTATWGASIAGGGANKVLAYYNGSAWTVAGK